MEIRSKHMTNKMTTRECAEEVRKSIKTIDRWIKQGFGKKKLRLHAERNGRSYLINPNTWKSYRWQIGKLYDSQEAA